MGNVNGAHPLPTLAEAEAALAEAAQLHAEAKEAAHTARVRESNAESRKLQAEKTLADVLAAQHPGVARLVADKLRQGR